MSILKRFWAIPLALVLLGVVTFGSPALAVPSDYFSQVATSLSSSPVFVDPAASPSISSAQAQQLASQIIGTHDSVYLVLVNNSEVSSLSGNQLPAAVHNAVGHSGVYAVSSAKGFYAQGFNVPTPVAQQAGTLASNAVFDSMQANGGKPVPFDVYRNYIASVAGIQVNTPSGSATSGSATNSNNATVSNNNASSEVGASNHKARSGLSTGVLVLIVLGGLLLLFGFIALVSRSKRRTSLRRSQLASLRRQIQQLDVDLLNIDSDARLNLSAKHAYDRALSNNQTASADIADGDANQAAAHLKAATKLYEEAQRILERTHSDGQDTTLSNSGMQQHYPWEHKHNVVSPVIDSNSNATSVRAKRPGGGTMVINQTTYAPQSFQTPGCNHYYRGGYYGGLYYGPGYYSDPFWNWVVLDAIEDSAYEQCERERYEDHDDGRRSDTDTGSVGGQTWSDPVVSTGDPGGSSWGGSSGDDSGSSESSYTPEPDPTPSYEPDRSSSGSSWDSGSSSDSGGSSWDSGGGGGYDSGSSSGDSGGGGW